MAQAMNDPMPKWLRKHLKAGVLSYKEAQAMHLQMMMGDPQQEMMTMPEWLSPACARINLMEMEA